MTWSKLYSVIEDNRSFLLSTHMNPDGDCICSELALYWYLVFRGKQAVIYNADPVPDKFTFLSNTDKITTEKPAGPFDVFITLDASNMSRLGWEGYAAMAPHTINIDHHRDNMFMAELNIVDDTAAATSQILYNFFHARSIDYPESVAQILYTGILSDTGGFQFSNTTGRVLRICGELADQGAHCSEIYTKVFKDCSKNGMMLRSRIWSTLTFYDDGRICSMEMPVKLVREMGANYGDIEGMADLALCGSSVEVSMFVKHQENNTHFSLRSRGTIDVGKIAQTIPGGGGHVNAAGCTVNLPLKQAKKLMLSIIRKELQ